jgi:hypothetical protein
MKNVLLVVKEENLKHCEHIAVKSQGVMMEWMDKKPMLFISTFHSDTMVRVLKRGNQIAI